LKNWRRVTAWLLVVLAGAAALTYVADGVWANYRLSGATGHEPLEPMTVYDATPLKNGKLEIFYDHPRTEVCLHSLFPHFGYLPCWYLVRNSVRVISGIRGFDPCSLHASDEVS
jgi:hypothetical protein